MTSNLFKCAGIMAIVAATNAYPAAPPPPDYPTKPVRIIVGFAPGGGTDTTARSIAAKLSDLLGQQVIVENRAGASGNIATELVAHANTDGYTLLMGTIAALAINPSLSRTKLPFDPIKDFAPIIHAVDSTNILSLHPSVAASSVKELITLAQSKPLNYGSSGVGGTGHLAGELFNMMAGTKMTHVPYKGGGPAMIDLLAGQVQLVFATASAVPHIKSGKIKGLAVTTQKRSALMPNIPTIAEAGLPGFDANNWLGLLAPAGTPRPIIMRLNKEVTQVLKMADVKEFLFNQGLDPAPGTPEQFGAYIKSETAKWAKVVKDSGARAD